MYVREKIVWCVVQHFKEMLHQTCNKGFDIVKIYFLYHYFVIYIFFTPWNYVNLFLLMLLCGS